MKHQTETIWTEFSTQLKQFILSRISDKSAADDILQEVFIKIHANITIIDYQCTECFPPESQKKS